MFNVDEAQISSAHEICTHKTDLVSMTYRIIPCEI